MRTVAGAGAARVVLCSLAVFDLLVVERGWTPEEYESWLVGALTHELLGYSGGQMS